MSTTRSPFFIARESDADHVRRRGWTVGTTLIADGVSSSEAVTITAIGREHVLAATMDGGEGIWSPVLHDWRADSTPGPESAERLARLEVLAKCADDLGAEALAYAEAGVEATATKFQYASALVRMYAEDAGAETPQRQDGEGR